MKILIFLLSTCAFFLISACAPPVEEDKNTKVETVSNNQNDKNEAPDDKTVETDETDETDETNDKTDDAREEAVTPPTPPPPPPKTTITISGQVVNLKEGSSIVLNSTYETLIVEDSGAIEFIVPIDELFEISVHSPSLEQSCEVTPTTFDTSDDISNLAIICNTAMTLGSLYTLHANAFNECVLNTYGANMLTSSITHIYCLPCDKIEQDTGNEVTITNCSTSKIDTLEGIEQFPNLEFLHVNHHDLQGIDLSNLPKLEQLNLAFGSRLSHHTLPPSITDLTLSDNQYTALNLTTLTNLEDLDIQNNNILTLSTSNNKDLAYINLTGNSALAMPDFSANTKLQPENIFLPAHLTLDKRYVSGSVKNLGSNTIVVSIGSANQIVTGNTTFQFEVTQGSSIDIQISNFPNTVYCQIDKAQHIVQQDIGGLEIDCHDRVELTQLLADHPGNFMNCVMDAKGSFTYADEITTIDCQNKDISDASGLEFFLNLETLNLSDNPLASIDLSYKYRLKKLYLQNTMISQIDTFSLPDIEESILTQLHVQASLDLKDNDQILLFLSNHTTVVIDKSTLSLVSAERNKDDVQILSKSDGKQYNALTQVDFINERLGIALKSPLNHQEAYIFFDRGEDVASYETFTIYNNSNTDYHAYQFKELSAPATLSWGDLTPYKDKLLAACLHTDDTSDLAYFFTVEGDELVYNLNSLSLTSSNPASDTWSLTSAEISKLSDCVRVSSTEYLFFTVDGKVIRYDAANHIIDSGYPKKLSDEWPAIP